jgi:hypothetical protein
MSYRTDNEEGQRVYSNISARSKAQAVQGQRVGYLRISSLDQNEVRQLERLARNKTDTDKASGKDVKRPQLEAMQSFVAGSAARRGRSREWLRGW